MILSLKNSFKKPIIILIQKPYIKKLKQEKKNHQKKKKIKN